MGSAILSEAVTDSRTGVDGLSWVRLHIGDTLVGDTIGDQPIGILLPLDKHWPVRLAAANRLYHQLIDHHADPSLTPQRRERLKRALRTVDGRQSGATYRAIATAFFGADRVAAEPWKTSSIKAQVARLAAYGRMMIDYGYKQLLECKAR